MSLRQVKTSRKSVRRVRRGAVRRACESAAPSIGPESRWEALEHRRLLTIVQPAGQTYLSFEAEHPEAVFTDLDGDGYDWDVVTGAQSAGNSTVPSGGAALLARRDPAGGALNDEGQVTYPIQLTTAGPYLFYARVKYTASGGDNSMFVPADGGSVADAPSVQWDNRADAQGEYHWNNLDVNGVSFDYSNPTPGAPTTLSLNIRENGYILDRIVLSQDPMTPAQLDALLGQSAIAFTGPQVNQVTVQFTPVSGANSYNILRGTSAAGPFALVGTAAGSATRFVDTTLPAGSTGQTFFYVVRPVTGGVEGPGTTPAPVVLNQGARGSYFNDHFWGSGSRASTKGTLEVFRPGPNPDFTEVVPNVDFNYDALGASPEPGVIRPDNHSTVFTGKITIPDDPADGPGGPVTVTFINNTDDDGIIFVNGVEVSDDMGPPGHGQRDATDNVPIDLVQGQSYNFVQLHAEQGGGSGVHLRWVNPLTLATEAVPAQYLSAVSDVPAAPAISAGTLGTSPERVVTFDLTDNSVSELWFELLRNGVVVGTAPMNALTITDAQPVPGTHQYTVRAVNYDGASPASAAQAVTVPADYYADTPTGASAYYFNSASWNGGRVGNGLSGGPDLVFGGQPDYGQTTANVDFDYAATANTPHPVISDEAFSTIHTGKLNLPADADGDGTPNETINIQFVGNTDDHGIYFVNGQVAAISFIPRGQGDYTGAPPMSLQEGQSYDFTILMVEQFGGAGVHFKWVNPATGTTEAVPGDALSPRTGAPAAPTDLAAAGTLNFIALSFRDNATSEVRYEVERAVVTGGVAGPFAKVADLPINSTTFVDRGAEPGVTYRYRVTAVNYEGRTVSAQTVDGARSATEVVPATPSNFTARNLGNRNVLTFTDNAVNETGYVIERRLAAGGTFAPIPGSPFVFNQAGQTGTITFTDTDPSIVAGTAYTYRLTAVNAAGSSGSVEATTTVIPAFRTTFYNSQYVGSGRAVVRGDTTFNYGWGTGQPDPEVPADSFSVWVEGTYTAPVAGDYMFSIIADDGERLFVDGQLVAESWADQGDTRVDSAPITLTAGQVVELRFQMYERGGGATARLLVTPPGGTEQAVVASGGPSAATPLRAPLNAAAAGKIGESINVTWLDTTANETGFEILRATAEAGPFAVVGTAQKDANFWSDLDVAQATTYYYQVRAVNGATQGPVSATTAGATAVGPSGGAVNMPNFANPDDQAQWQLNGVAAFADVDLDPESTTERLRLTDNVNDQTASAFLIEPRDLKGFTAEFDFSLSESNGADGFTFVINGSDAGNAAIGGGGGALGYVGDALRNSFAIKFDIYPNPATNMIGVYENGVSVGAGSITNANDGDNPADPRNRALALPLDTAVNAADIVYHTVVSYNHDTHVLTITIDDVGNPATQPFVATYNNVDVPAVVNSGSGYLGFTGATGGLNAEQDILGFSFTPGAVVPPALTVTQVFVNGPTLTNGAAAFKAAAGVDATFGYAVPGGAVQTTPLSWVGGINAVSIRFSADVAAALAQGDLVINGSGGAIPTTGFTYDAATRTGTWTFAAVTRDKLRFVLDDAGVSGLDGEWANPTETFPGVGGDSYPSGDGTAGGDFNFRVNVLHGDVSGDGVVNATDVAEIKRRLTRRPNDGVTDPLRMYTIFSDITGDGVINANDLAQVKARLTHRINTLPNPATALLQS